MVVVPYSKCQAVAAPPESIGAFRIALWGDSPVAAPPGFAEPLSVALSVVTLVAGWDTAVGAAARVVNVRSVPVLVPAVENYIVVLMLILRNQHPVGVRLVAWEEPLWV